MKRISESRVWVIVLSVLSALIAALPISAQTTAPTTDTMPVETDTQSDTTPPPDYTARIEKLLEKLEQQRLEHNVPGLGLAIVHNDTIIVCTGLGNANLKENIPATGDTVFAIGSATKAFATTLIGMLVDDEKMQWDEPMRTHLPNAHLYDTEADENTTIRDLVAHRTGLSRMGLLWAPGKLSRNEIIAAVVDAEPMYPFRTKFNYSNINYIIAGEASARAAGMPWNTLLQTRLFDPLQMTNSTVTVDAARAKGNLATGYVYDDINDTFDLDPMRSIDAGAPAGAINSSVRDMTNWLRFQLADGEYAGQRLIRETNLNETRTAQMEMSPSMSYGLGWMLGERDGLAVVEHGGNIDGFSAQVAFIPELNLGYVLLMNCSFTPLQALANSVVFGALLDEETDDTSLAQYNLNEYTGKYVADFGPFQDARFTVQIKNGKLAIDIPGQMLFELKPPDDEDKWYFAITDQVAVSFVRDEHDKINSLVMHQGGVGIELPREGVVIPAEVELADVRHYFGTYHFGPIDADVEVLINKGKLAVDVPGQMVYELHLPNEQGRWVFRATDTIAVRFNESDDGTIGSMTMYQDGQVFELPRSGSPDPSELVTLDDVMALQQKAYGSANLDDIKTTRITGTIHFKNQAVHGTFEILTSGMTHYSNRLNIGNSDWINITVAGDRGWSVLTFDQTSELEGKYLNAAKRQHPLMVVADWREVMDELSLKEVIEKDGREFYVLRARLGEMIKTTIMLDAETGLVTSEELVVMAPGVGALPLHVKYDDYREVAGIMLPFHVESSNMWHGTTVLQYDSIEANVDLPDDTFDPPADL